MTTTRRAMALLREANPVPNPVVEAGRRTAKRSRGARGRRWGVLAVASAGLAALALLVGLIPLPWTHGNATPAAAAALDQAATAADILARDEAARPDQYWRITYAETNLVTTSSLDNPEDSGAYLLRSTQTRYAAVDGSRPDWFVEDGRSTVERVFSGADPSASLEPGMSWTTGLAPNDTPGAWQKPNVPWLAALPRDPAALRDRLYDDTSGHGRSHDGEVLVYVADVLTSGLVPADLRAALFRVLETVPGVDIVRRHDDGLISIGRLESVDGERQEIVIDPSTGAYVGERRTQLDGYPELGVPAGALVGASTVTTTLVDSVPQEVRDTAQHQTCEVSEDGGIGCSSP